MKRTKFIYISISGLLLLSVILSGCHRSEPDNPGPYNIWPPWVGISVSNISDSSVALRGITSHFEGYSITNYGFNWSLNNNSTEINNEIPCGSDFRYTFIGSIPDTPYYFRAYVKYHKGKSVGYAQSLPKKIIFYKGQNGIIFNRMLIYGNLSDVENNSYKTIQIGVQVWMAENLKTTSYNDATHISKTEDMKAWANLKTPAYCWYSNDSSKYKSTGALYNWYAINTGKLCPTGWHVPTDTEWYTLNYLGGQNNAGNNLKEIGNLHWVWPGNTGATNESGFTALPCGYRDFNGTFNEIGFRGFWWSAQENEALNGIDWVLFFDSGTLSRESRGKNYGLSVRCVKN